MGAPGFDYDSGFGLIQADAALAVSPNGLSNISTRGSVLTGRQCDDRRIHHRRDEGQNDFNKGAWTIDERRTILDPRNIGKSFFTTIFRVTVIAQNNDWQTTDPVCGVWDLPVVGLQKLQRRI